MRINRDSFYFTILKSAINDSTGPFDMEDIDIYVLEACKKSSDFPHRMQAIKELAVDAKQPINKDNLITIMNQIIDIVDESTGRN